MESQSWARTHTHYQEHSSQLVKQVGLIMEVHFLSAVSFSRCVSSELSSWLQQEFSSHAGEFLVTIARCDIIRRTYLVLLDNLYQLLGDSFTLESNIFYMLVEEHATHQVYLHRSAMTLSITSSASLLGG